MGDVGDYFRDYRAWKKERKASNYEYCLEVLKASGLEFKVLNEHQGHIRVGEYDLWATTQLFIHRKSGKRGRGVTGLIIKIEKEAKANELRTDSE